MLLVFGLASFALGGCSSSDNGPGSTGSGGASPTGTGGGSGGTPGTGGAIGSGGTSASGGSTTTGGAKGSGGAQGGTGGASASGGSSSSVPATGGSPAGGTTSSSSAKGGSVGSGGVTTGSGGMATGSGGIAMGSGGAAKGGTSGGVGGTGTTAKGGATGGGSTGTSSGTCQKGQVKPSEVVFMGESFYAIDPQYNEKRVETNAQAAGALATGAKYRNVAVSAQPMSYIAGTEWTNASSGGAVKVVIMDGGGIDCLTSSSCPTCASQFTTLLGKMATAGVQDVIYTRYPEPGAPPGSNASLKKCLDTIMPTMQPVCEGATGLKCHWVDLRPVFVAGDTTDGLHPTESGGKHVGDAIWAEMVKDCIAQ
jgi:hypothetical protein